MQILLVDDDPVFLALLAGAVAAAGHAVSTARDGEAAWEALRDGSCRVVISDWSMPGLTGTELCRRVRAAPAREYTYFILLTATGGAARLQEAMDAGVDDFLPKPLDIDALAVRLRVADRILAFHRQIGQLTELLPICMYCKKIRDDRKFWVNVDSYFAAHSGAEFTHSLCPECHTEKILPQFRELEAPSPPVPPPSGPA